MAGHTWVEPIHATIARRQRAPTVAVRAVFLLNSLPKTLSPKSINLNGSCERIGREEKGSTPCTPCRFRNDLGLKTVPAAILDQRRCLADQTRSLTDDIKRRQAEILVRKCGSLPLALLAVARALASK
ncbi:hypothetical protein C4D60_Mb02t00180 [Musa balbisiana]|uniref:Uncharacterized protein n=1 Tax=Musa balbisiana TaxID=52838 RepID=A0A4S8I767_MUSBA|nr:hypothetical protein C4D60_Mb02t00180 [Musa balbisiana]